MGAWGCATVREFMGFMADAKIVAPKGQLFLALLPFPPNRGMNNAWEQVYLDAQRNPGRDTLQQSAKSKSSLPAGKGSDRLIVCRRPPHVRQRGNPVSYHPAGYYALKDNMISLSCMPIAYNMDTGTIMFNTAFKYLGGPKFGTGPGRGDERCLWPIATHTCPTCGANFPADLHMCHSCAKPIHYPDGMSYADIPRTDLRWSMMASTQSGSAMSSGLGTRINRILTMLSSICGTSPSHDHWPKITDNGLLWGQRDSMRIRRSVDERD